MYGGRFTAHVQRPSVIDLARSLLAVAVATAFGTLLDRVFRFGPRSLARWPIRALAALVLLYLFRVLPLLCVVVLGAGLLSRPRSGPDMEPPMSREDRAWAGLTVAILAAITMLRLPATLYWDEMVWLAKARIEAESLGALTAEALRVGTSTIPPGYPLFEPLSISALAGYGGSTRALVFGAEFLTIVAGAALLLTAIERRHTASRRDLVAAALGCACPLVLVHLRSAYVDLELGMLAAMLLLLLEARETRAAAVVALALVAMKDEGIAHLLAIASVSVVSSLVRRRRRDAVHGAVVAIVGYACFAGWRARLVSSGVVDSDHLMGLPSLARIPDVVRHALLAASDVLGWGALWAATLGMLIAGVLRPSTMNARTRTRSLVLGAQAALLFGAVLCSPDRVMDFLHAGTLLPRLFVQLAPSAMLALASSLAYDAGAAA